jgi:hypothetical protein
LSASVAETWNTLEPEKPQVTLNIIAHGIEYRCIRIWHEYWTGRFRRMAREVTNSESDVFVNLPEKLQHGNLRFSLTGPSSYEYWFRRFRRLAEKFRNRNRSFSLTDQRCNETGIGHFRRLTR